MMNAERKNNSEILDKLGISQLNEMQLAAQEAFKNDKEIVILSPTGTGKTLAFLLPLLNLLDPHFSGVQVLILVPSRELAIQIESVLREMGSGFKVNAVYGGRSGSTDRLLLSTPPSILIGTPGRVADHLRREVIKSSSIQTLILDEFDKSLETGFEGEMREIMAALPRLERKILTSATQQVQVPAFIKLQNPVQLNFLSNKTNKLTVKIISSPTPNKLGTLKDLLMSLGHSRGIVFCNFKDSIDAISEYLWQENLPHSLFYGGLEQQQRERALIKFRNGTHRILLATDLAARGIDVPDLDYIIHYQLPYKHEEFVHRNGRTARMQATGTAYVLTHDKQELPDFIEGETLEKLPRSTAVSPSTAWETLFISGGRRDKISKGDIAGLFIKQGGLEMEELGVIELKQECAFVAVPANKSAQLIKKLNNSKIKKRKVRITILN